MRNSVAILKIKRFLQTKRQEGLLERMLWVSFTLDGWPIRKFVRNLSVEVY